jgi:glycosyltransferase involved in cell wall biosynthesis
MTEVGNAASKPLRILHLATHTGVAGGGAVQMARMAIGLKQRGHHVVCGFNWRDFRGGEGERHYEPVEKHDIPCVAFRMEKFIATVMGDRRRFVRFVQQQNFDIIHLHKPRALRFALQSLSPELKKPVLVAQRGNCYPVDEYSRDLLNDPRIKAVVCVAEEVKRITIEGGVTPEKVHAIYGGVHPEEFVPNIDPLPVKRELGIPDSAPVVGIVANFDGKKAHSLFFKGAAQIMEKIPDVRFLVVGRGAPADLPQYLDKLGIRDRVIVTGFRTDVPRMFAAMDVSVNISNRGEGLTGAMRESLCMERPVVCTDIGGNRELVRPHETGLLISPNDVTAFVEATLELLQNPQRAREMACAGRELVLRDFTEDVRISRLEQLYYSIAG